MINKRITLTGGSGFIAKALTNRLAHDNVILRIERTSYYDRDLTEELEQFNPHIIFHLGAYGNHSTQTDDVETFEANIVKTFLLLHATKDIPYEAFISFGSSSEYGVKNLSMKEEDLLEPQTMYGGTKAAGTMLARAFAKKYSKPIVTVRPFSVYGPGEASFRFIPTVIRSLIKSEEFQLEPQAFHDWIYIDDLIEGILTVVDAAPLLSGNAINIGTGKQYKNEEIVSLLGLISGKSPQVAKTVLRPQDSPNWRADVSTLRLCGWKPQVTLLEGLKRTYQYYQKLYGNQ